MAKVFTIWLMLVYAFSATGASVHLHYCCGKLQHLTVANEPAANHGDCKLCLDDGNSHTDRNNSLPCSADVQSQDHCQDIKVDAPKNTGDHLPSSDNKLLKIQLLGLPVFSLIHRADVPLGNCDTIETANAPPRAGTTPLFIRYCAYLI
ncbi:hypothetical protein [Parapedobacter sp.]